MHIIGMIPTIETKEMLGWVQTLDPCVQNEQEVDSEVGGNYLSIVQVNFKINFVK